MEDSESGTFSEFERRQLEGNNQLYGSPNQIYCFCRWREGLIGGKPI